MDPSQNHLDSKGADAPTLLRYELANMCARKARANPELRDELRSALGLFPRLAIREVQVPAEAMVETAHRTGLTAYDAAYLWLASELGAALVSLDRKLPDAAESS